MFLNLVPVASFFLSWFVAQKNDIIDTIHKLDTFKCIAAECEIYDIFINKIRVLNSKVDDLAYLNSQLLIFESVQSKLFEFEVFFRFVSL